MRALIDKHCPRCKEVKPHTPKGTTCRDCAQERSRAHYKRNKDCPEFKRKRSDRHFLREYGITTEQRDHLLELQGGVCYICGTVIMGEGKAHVDHCHTTGNVRAMLCYNCNDGLGRFKDDPSLLITAAQYIVDHAVRDGIDPSIYKRGQNESTH